MTLPDVQAVVPGGRHDNDKEDFRTIQIVPTIGEITCDSLPFLPLSTDRIPILERHFRLLREDMLQPVREALKLKGKDKHSLIFQNARFEGIRIPDKKFSSGSACVRVSFEVPPWHPTRKYTEWHKRKDYWEDRGHKVFARESLVAIYNGGKLMRFGIVEWRDEETMAKGLPNPKNPLPANVIPRPVIGIVFLTEQDLEDSLQQFGTDMSLELVQVPVSLFAYTPVLEQLQTMPDIPFQDELTTDTVHTSQPTYVQGPLASLIKSITPNESDTR